MVYFKNGSYHLSKLLVKYIDESEGEVTKAVKSEGKSYWETLAENFKDTFQLLGFEEIEIKEEWIDRLNEVNSLGIKEGVSLIEEYVIDNDLSEVEKQHPLYSLRVERDLRKENANLRKSSQMSLSTIMQLDKKVIELEKKINEINK